jgi:hypothetical protein
VDLDGFQIKSKSNPNQYTPPGFGKSTKSNKLHATQQEADDTTFSRHGSRLVADFSSILSDESHRRFFF